MCVCLMMSTETDWSVKKNIKRKSCRLYDNCRPLEVSNKNAIGLYACVYSWEKQLTEFPFSRQRQTALSSHWTRVHSIMIWIVIFHWFSSTRNKCVACSTCYISVFVACCEGTDNGNVNVLGFVTCAGRTYGQMCTQAKWLQHVYLRFTVLVAAP